MKIKYKYLISASILFGLSACKKGNTNPQAGIVGKWYETKLTIQQKTISSGVVKSATFAGNDFTTADYFQFNNDKTAVSSWNGAHFTINGMFEPPTANAIAGGQSNFTLYTVKGSMLILQTGVWFTCNGCPPPPPDTLQIVKLSANTLVLQQLIDTSSTYKVTTDTYYTKEK